MILKFFVKEAQVAVTRTAGNIIDRAIGIGEFGGIVRVPKENY
ncbi:hypothetical protein [Paenibacillus xylanexedens]|nr:hypothetical protein [Paenibacillus xylanexedens]